MSQTVLTMLALFTGALIPFQLAFNGQLGTALKNVYLGAFFVFLIGLLTLLIILITQRVAWPTALEMGAVPWTAWLGGIIATAYIVAVVFLIPRLGVGSTAVLIIAGQIVAAMVLDQMGAFGAAANPANLTRIGGAGLVIFGAALVKFG